MPQTIADPIDVVVGQTTTVTFKMKGRGGDAIDFTGATLKLSLWSADNDNELWDFDHANAALTHDNTGGNVTWTPADADVFSKSELCFGQLKITWSDATIDYWPKDFHDWQWHIYPKTTD